MHIDQYQKEVLVNMPSFSYIVLQIKALTWRQLSLC